MKIWELPHDGPTEVYTPKEGVDIIVTECLASGSVLKGRKKERFYKAIASFDIETTKLENEAWCKGIAESYRYFNYTYCWQFIIGDKFIFGREAGEFFRMLDKAAEELDGTLIIWIHNMAYEVNNLADYFYGDRMRKSFWKNATTPLFINFDHYQFRCSAQLTHRSLAMLGDDVGITKLKEEFDYNRIIGPKDPLSAADLNYCFRDVKILSAYLKKETEQYCASVRKEACPVYLPYTQTGYVRKDMQEHFSNTPAGWHLLQDTALGEDVYNDIKPGFYGGFVHGNYRVIGEVITDPFLHVDIVSAYPWAMVTKPYMLHIRECSVYDSELLVANLARPTYGQIADITITECWLKKGRVPYIPYVEGNTKVIALKNELGVVHTIEENGKLIYADKVRLTVCDTDLRMILENYEVKPEQIHINKLYVGTKRRLPYEVVSRVLHFYEQKTTLKGISSPDGSVEYMYGLSKQKLNSCYGMSAQALENQTIELLEGALMPEIVGSEYQDSKTLPYQIALQITSYVREVVYSFISYLQRTPGNLAYYSDTDSVFCKDTPEAREYIRKYNEARVAELEQLRLRYFNIIPCNRKGEPQYLGCLDLEKDCKDALEFCTIGAKRYYIKHADGLVDITFSGLRATKVWEDENGIRHNGRNTERLIEKYGSVAKAFHQIVEGDVVLPYEEGTDKLSNYNVRSNFVSHQFGYKVTRPCTYTLYGMGTRLSLNESLKEFMGSEIAEDLY